MTPSPILSAVGTYLDAEIFGRLNAAIASEPPEEPEAPRSAGPTKICPHCGCTVYGKGHCQRHRIRKPHCEHCDSPIYCAGMCITHYSRMRVHGDPLYEPPKAAKGCQVPRCPKPSGGCGLCDMHRKRLKATGDAELQRIADAHRVQGRKAGAA